MNKQEALQILQQNRSLLTPDQQQVLDKFSTPGKAGMTHQYAPTVREQLGAQLGTTVRNESDIPFMARADLGLTDNPAEFDAKFQSMFPDYKMSRVPRAPGLQAADVVYQKPGEAFARRYDEPGMSMGDLADLSGAAPEIAGSLAALMIPGARESYLANILKSAGGAAAGYLGKEGVETARGHQQDSLEDVLKQAGITAAMDAGMGSIPALGSLVRGKRVGAPQSTLDDIAAVERMTGQPDAPPIESIMGVQKGTAGPITERAFRQSASTSVDIQNKIARQAESAQQALESMAKESPSKLGRYFQREGDKAVTNAEREILSRYGVKVQSGPEAVGKKAQSVVTDFDTGSRKAINNAYDKVRQEAAGSDMLFDLSNVQRRLDDLGTYATKTDEVQGSIVGVQGKPLSVQMVNDYIDVSADVPGQVNRAMSLIRQIDPQQTNWEVVKQLRTRVGDAIEKWPSDATQSSGKAKAVWAELSNTLENPQGATTGFKDALKDASRAARDRFEMFEKPSVQALMKSDNYAQIAGELTNPLGATSFVRNLMDKWAPGKANAVREHMQYKILSSDSPADTMKTFIKDHPEMIGWMNKNGSSKQFGEAVNAMQNLRESPVAKLMSTGTEDVDMARKLLFDVDSPKNIDTILTTYGGRGSPGHEKLRLGVMNEMVDKVFKYTSDGKRAVNKQEFASVIADMRKSGVWDKILTKQDRTNLSGLDAYARMVIRSLSDTGTTLEQAQLIAGLKHKDTFMKSVVGLAMNNKVIAPMLMSDKWSRLMIPTGKPKTASPQFWTQFSTLATSMADAANTADRNGWLDQPSPMPQR